MHHRQDYSRNGSLDNQYLNNNNANRINYILLLKSILWADRPVLTTILIYGIIISILSLAAPISVQLLINSVSFTAMLQPILVIGSILLLLVLFFGLTNIFQFFACEVFQRRFFARMSYEVGISLLNAKYNAIEKENKAQIVNQFFETSNIQKIIPKLFSKTFTTILQSFAGLVLIAFYHPFFLMFSVGILLSIFLIWQCFAPKAIAHSILESKKKYELVKWFEDITKNQLIFKTFAGREYAKFKIDYLTGLYLKERNLHFKGLFWQSILLFALYAIATTILLVLGGWLVLKNQLSLGQLVASELVISVILYNISGLSRDFENFYDVIASAEKLLQFTFISQEKLAGKEVLKQITEIKFDKVSFPDLNYDCHFDFSVSRGSNYLVEANNYLSRKTIIETLMGFREVFQGEVTINQANIHNLDKLSLRSLIAIIDDAPLFDSTLREYIAFNDSNFPDSYIFKTLINLGVSKLEISKFDLDVKISEGRFSPAEKLIIKFARTLILGSEVIIIDDAFDVHDIKLYEHILKCLADQFDGIIVYFSGVGQSLNGFDKKLLI